MTPTPFVRLPEGVFTAEAVERIHQHRETYYASCPEHTDAKVTFWKELLVRDSDGQWHLPLTALYSCGHMISGPRLDTDDEFKLGSAPA